MSDSIPLRISGTGRCVPDKILTNAELEKMVDTTDDWITSRTGIKERHIAEKGMSTSVLALGAARGALASSKTLPEELDLIIVATATPDMFFPSTACLVQRALGAKKAACLDVSAACTGFIYALSMARGFLLQGEGKKALVIGAEVLSPFIDWTDRNTCVLFGDGAGAVVLEKDPGGRPGLMGVHVAADGTGADLLCIPGGGSLHPPTVESLQTKLHTLKMEGKEVFKKAVAGMGEAAETVLARVGFKTEDLALVIPHQANTRIIEATARRLKVPLEKIFVNLDRFGNTSAASIPLALDEAVEKGRLNEGDAYLLVAFGAGFTMGAAAGRWGKLGAKA